MAVAGAYDHAAIYEIKPGTTVKDVLALGGGVPTLAATQKALIERIDGSQKSPRQMNDLVLNAQGLSQSLQDGDILFIDSTHTVKTGSDCLHIYLRLLPKITKKTKVPVIEKYLFLENCTLKEKTF